jgi:Tol biopolymer transport system component
MAFLPGCETIGLSLDELPMDPIAVTYWHGEKARRRAELLEEEKKVRPQKRGVAHVDGIRRLLGVTDRPDQLSRYPGRLCLVNPRTGEVTTIAQAPRGSLPLAWSEDHDRLLFLSNHKHRIQVYEYSRSTEAVRTITYGERAHMFADYGLAEQLVLLEVATIGERQFERVFVTEAGQGSPRLVFEDRNAQTVRLSPDGKTLLYVRRFPSKPGRVARPSGLVALDLATGEERELGPGREPSFSPIGDWIVYSAPSRDGWRLRRMRPDGSARSPIAGGIRDEKMPSVSPDGRFIVYVGKSTGLERLFVRRMDGTGDRILLDVGAVFSPVW